MEDFDEVRDEVCEGIRHAFPNYDRRREFEGYQNQLYNVAADALRKVDDVWDAYDRVWMLLPGYARVCTLHHFLEVFPDFDWAEHIDD